MERLWWRRRYIRPLPSRLPEQVVLLQPGDAGRPLPTTPTGNKAPGANRGCFFPLLLQEPDATKEKPRRTKFMPKIQQSSPFWRRSQSYSYYHRLILAPQDINETTTTTTTRPGWKRSSSSSNSFGFFSLVSDAAPTKEKGVALWERLKKRWGFGRRKGTTTKIAACPR